MTGLSIMAIGVLTFCAAAPALPLLFDVIDLHAQTGPALIEALDDAQACARTRAGI